METLNCSSYVSELLDLRRILEPKWLRVQATIHTHTIYMDSAKAGHVFLVLGFGVLDVG